MKAFTVRRINDSDLDDFIRIRLEALRLHPAAFGASYEDWKQKSAEFLLKSCVWKRYLEDSIFKIHYKG